MRLTLRNARLVTSAGIVLGGLISEDGSIVHIGADAGLPTAGDVIDARGRWVIPGLIDPHTHIGAGPAEADLNRFPSQWESESRGAVHKGITTIISYLGGSPIPVEESHLTQLDQQIAWAESNSYADFAFHAIVQSDAHIGEQAELARRGVVGFKHYYTAFKPGADPTMDQMPLGYSDDGMLYASMRNLGSLKANGARVMAMVHAEDADICGRLELEVRSTGRMDLAAWTEARPSVACHSRSLAASAISKATDCPLYIVHVSTAEEVIMLRRLRDEGLSVYGETVLHYLSHTCEEESTYGSWLKVIPSMKFDRDRQSLWRGLQDGSILTVGTDHCAYTREEKEGAGGRQFDNIWDALPGMTGMECTLPLLLTHGVRAGKFGYEQLARICSENAARAFGLYPRKGVLQVGSDADFVIVDETKQAVVDDGYYVGGTPDWSVYHGFEFKGMPVTTVIRGRVVVEDGRIASQAGIGRYVPA